MSVETLARAIVDEILSRVPDRRVDAASEPPGWTSATRSLLSAFDHVGLGTAERALMFALDEFELQRGWNPDLHPRWTTGTADGKGGQFRPLTAQILGALTEWQQSGGSKSGVEPFKGFTDTQLRKVAKARGLYGTDPKTGRAKLRSDGTMDPRELVASQSELSGPKVAKLYGFMGAGWKPGGVMIIARSGDEWAVVDGHHRWAGAAARSVSGDDTLEVDVMMIDADIDDVLGTPEHPDGVVMGFASFEGLGADREG